MERERAVQYAVPTGKGGRLITRLHCPPAAEVGVRSAWSLFDVWATDDRRRSRVYWIRFRLSIFAGRGDRMRLLGISGAGGLAEHANARPGQTGIDPDGGILRRHQGQRLLGGREKR